MSLLTPWRSLRLSLPETKHLLTGWFAIPDSSVFINRQQLE